MNRFAISRRRRRVAPRLLLAALALLTPASSLPAATAAPAILIRGGRIVDLDGSRLTAPVDILVAGGRIVSIGPASSRRVAGARVVDARGRFLLPGFIEMHAHVLLHPWLPNGEIARQYDRESSLRLLRLLLAHGITTVRDPGSPTEAGLLLRQMIADGRIEGPSLHMAGRILIGGAFPYEPFTAVADRDDVAREVAWQASAGVDFIKVYSSIGPDLLEAAVKEARARKLKVVGHLGRTSWTRAAELGIDGVEHPSDWSPDHLPLGSATPIRPGMIGRVDWLNAVDPGGPQIARMARALARNAVVVDPTLITIHTKFFGDDPRYRNPAGRALVPDLVWNGWERGSFTSDWTSRDYAEAKAAYPKLPRIVRALFDNGVLLVVGTDTPTPWTIPGVSYHQELALLRETGVSNADVLRMATVNGARALGLERELGRLAAGYQADILILRANPLADLAHARSIETVISDGRLIQPRGLLAPRAAGGR